MPVYEYRCEKCGAEFEVSEKITAPFKRKCRFCSGKAVRLISASSFILKGTGWYVTDYARKGAGEDTGEDKKSKDKGKDKDKVKDKVASAAKDEKGKAANEKSVQPQEE